MEKYNQAEQAFMEAQDSQYGLFTNKHKTLEIIKAAIFWKNFEGRMNQFGNATRNFKVAVPQAVAIELEQRGWNVKSRPLTRKDIDGNDVPPVIIDEKGQPCVLYFIEVKVNMESEWPPVITRISQFNGERVDELMNIANIKDLDHDTFLDCSIEVNERINPKTNKATGYLRMMTVVTDPAEKEADFGGRYENYKFND